MEDNPYKAPSNSMVEATDNDKWIRRIRRWSYGQPIAIFFLALLAVGTFLAILLPLWQRLNGDR